MKCWKIKAKDKPRIRVDEVNYLKRTATCSQMKQEGNEVI
jgi:hypothetical protein